MARASRWLWRRSLFLGLDILGGLPVFRSGSGSRPPHPGIKKSASRPPVKPAKRLLDMEMLEFRNGPTETIGTGLTHLALMEAALQPHAPRPEAAVRLELGTWTGAVAPPPVAGISSGSRANVPPVPIAIVPTSRAAAESVRPPLRSTQTGGLADPAAPFDWADEPFAPNSGRIHRPPLTEPSDRSGPARSAVADGAVPGAAAGIRPEPSGPTADAFPSGRAGAPLIHWSRRAAPAGGSRSRSASISR